MRQTTMERIRQERIIAIIRGVEGGGTLEAARAIYEGGISLIEVTFSQKSPHTWRNTAEAISQLCGHFGDKVSVGAGTVLTAEQCRMAADAGAKYIVSPNTDTGVIRLTRELNMVSIPGSMTPSEMVNAHSSGADFCKLFPAASLGAGYIKSVRAPLSHIDIIATGGIDADNLHEYLDAGCCGLGIGGNLANRAWIEAGEFGKITETARELCRAAEAAVANT